jgi:hypothetical protein
MKNVTEKPHPHLTLDMGSASSDQGCEPITGDLSGRRVARYDVILSYTKGPLKVTAVGLLILGYGIYQQLNPPLETENAGIEYIVGGSIIAGVAGLIACIAGCIVRNDDQLASELPPPYCPTCFPIGQ